MLPTSENVWLFTFYKNWLMDNSFIDILSYATFYLPKCRYIHVWLDA